MGEEIRAGFVVILSDQYEGQRCGRQGKCRCAWTAYSFKQQTSEEAVTTELFVSWQILLVPGDQKW